MIWSWVGGTFGRWFHLPAVSDNISSPSPSTHFMGLVSSGFIHFHSNDGSNNNSHNNNNNSNSNSNSNERKDKSQGNGLDSFLISAFFPSFFLLR